jgi:Kef-type K+ transport system membrane component KefB
MHSAQLLIVLAVATVTLGAVTVLRRAGIPAPVTLVVAGLVIGFLPFCSGCCRCWSSTRP